MEDHLYQVVCTRRLEDHRTIEASRHGIDLQSHEFVTVSLLPVSTFSGIIAEHASPLIFTSANAVRALACQDTTVIQSLHNRSCFCISGATSRLAQATGFDIIGTAPNAGELARVIAAAGVKKALHCSAADRRTDLSDILNDSGVSLSYCEVYRKSASPRAYNSFDGVIFYSPSQVNAFLSANVLLQETPAFCIGATTADHLRTFGHRQIFTSPGATTDYLLQTLFQHFNR